MGLPIFPEANTIGVELFMITVYGYILLTASTWMGDGCEILVLLYGSGIIGSILLPILGALPDSLLILLSGLGGGTKAEIEEQLLVGVGTLVGSTVMLLTLPWGAAILLGRRDIDSQTGDAAYSISASGRKKPLLTHFSIYTNGVTVLDDVLVSAKILLVLSLSYWVIQIPAFIYHNDVDHGAYHEKPYALAGLIITILTLIGYCVYQVFSSNTDEQLRRQQEAQRRVQWQSTLHKKYSLEMFQEEVFKRHDQDGNGFMDARELYNALQELGLKLERRDVAHILESMDTGDNNDPAARAGDGQLSLAEFKKAVSSWTKGATSGNEHAHHEAVASINMPLASADTLEKAEDASEHDEKHDEEEEEEEDQLWELTDSQLKWKAFGLLAIATTVIAVFSDPLIEAIGNFGQSIGVKPFYISFVLTPLFSNASECLAGLQFARKKTNESISLCHSSLLGGASMNASMCLCVFMCLIYFRELSWSFSAEVITLCLVSTIVGVMSATIKTLKVWHGIFAMCLYPLSVLLVWILEEVGGLD